MTGTAFQPCSSAFYKRLKRFALCHIWWWCCCCVRVTYAHQSPFEMVSIVLVVVSVLLHTQLESNLHRKFRIETDTKRSIYSLSYHISGTLVPAKMGKEQFDYSLWVDCFVVSASAFNAPHLHLRQHCNGFFGYCVCAAFSRQMFACPLAWIKLRSGSDDAANPLKLDTKHLTWHVMFQPMCQWFAPSVCVCSGDNDTALA